MHSPVGRLIPTTGFKDGNLVCFFQSAQKFKTRYATLGLMWPTAFALKDLSAAEEAKIAALVKRAVS